MIIVPFLCNSADALFNIGTVYESGVHHPQRTADPSMAFSYYRDAAAKSHQRALVKVATMLLSGEGVAARDPVEAVVWLRQAVALNNAEAMNQLGQLYEIGVGVAQSMDEAKRLYAKALALGNDRAMLNMAAIYEAGISVDRDLDKALKLYAEVCIGCSGK